MPRLNIQVDLKESDLIEKQLKKECQGLAKGMAREAMNGALEDEINRLVDVKIADAKKGDYYSTIVHNVSRSVAARVGQDIKLDHEEINKIVHARVDEYLDRMMVNFGGIDKFVESYIKQSIADALKK